MSDLAQRRSDPMTVEQFLTFVENRSPDEKWELIEGAPMMMTGVYGRSRGGAAVRACADF
jgi:hypothetical protein